VKVKHIDKTLCQGTPKQRMMLLCEHVSRNCYDRPGLLSSREFTELSKSFKSHDELRLYSDMRKQEETIRYYMPNISIQAVNYHGIMNKLSGQYALYLEYTRQENVLNEILHAIGEENAELQERAANIMVSRRMTGAEVSRGEDGYISIGIDGNGDSYSLGREIEQLRSQAHAALVMVKTQIKMIRDYMAEMDMAIRKYEEMLGEVDETLRSNDLGVEWPEGEIEGLGNRDKNPQYDEVEINESYYTREYKSFF